MSLSFDSLKALLQKHHAYLTQEGDLNIALLHTKAQECDSELLRALSDDDDVRNAFFFKQNEHIIFVRDKFIDYISHKNFLANSYTAYKNKIGLHDGVDYLKKTSDVVLAFPFKDCVLEGGQSKEESKRNERYYNRVLAAEEIDRLLDPKVLTKTRRYTKGGMTPLVDFRREKAVNEKRGSSENTITDNLIIKGNNLLALHTLKRQFAGKVKLIYIDPPYNTGNDSFNYNDNFNHSTWLVFMKNRLEVARELLREDGVVFVQCDDNEQAYLKVLMDEVFRRENFVGNIIWEKKFSPQNDAKWLSDNHDFVILYAKNKESWNINLLPRTNEMNDRYKNIDNDPRGAWMSGALQVKTYEKKYDYPIITPSGREVWAGNGSCWRYSKERLEELIKDNRIWFGTDGNSVPRLKRFLSDVKDGLVPLTLWRHTDVGHNQKAKQNLGKLNIDFATPKPEALLERILHIATQPGDIVLDYHLGSGTTAAVAHKMGRQYIGVEQMDYIESIAVERLKKVLEGEQGGVSKAVQWNGGGDFVYFELKTHNQAFIERIAAATTSQVLLALKNDILAKADIDYRLDTDAIAQTCEEFSALSVKEQKEVLVDFLELNQLYVPYTERGDTRFACTDEEKVVSENFYRN